MEAPVLRQWSLILFLTLGVSRVALAEPLHLTSMNGIETLRFPDGITRARLLAAMQAHELELLSVTRPLPAFSATYVVHEGETVEEALAAFAADVEHIRTEMLRSGAFDRATLERDQPEVFIALRMRVTKADATVLESFIDDLQTRVEIVPPQAPRASEQRTPVADAICSDGVTVPSAGAAFVPPTGYVTYNASSKELFSYFSWTDTSWTTANGKVAYEHDMVVDGGRDDFVRWGPGTWATNLPNPYRDDETSDETTTLTIGTYPATVSPGVTYMVRIPIQVVNASNGPRPLFLNPQRGSWQNRACEFTYCWILAPLPGTPGACVFSDLSSNDLRFYRDRNASTPLFTRINFDTASSWTFNWDSDFELAEKTCPDTMYRGEYYNETFLDEGNRLMRYVRCDAAINFNWGSQGPGLGIRNDQFSIRWTRRANFRNGTYDFLVRSDDGSRLSLDGVTKINAWHESGTPGSSFTASITGQHDVKFEYYENGGTAQVFLQIQQQKPAAPTSVVASSPSSGQLLARWTDANTDETYFSVGLKSPNAAWNDTRVAPANATSATISGLTAGSTYGVRVRACNDGGCSMYSNESFVTIRGTAGPSCYILSAFGSPTAGGYPAIQTLPNCNNAGYTAGTAISLTANNYSGYQFSDWTSSNCTLANVTSTSTTCSVTGAGDIMVTANFIAVSTPPSGTINVSGLSDGVPWDGLITLTVNGPSGMVQNITSIPISFAVPAPGTYTLNYVSGGPVGKMVSGITPSSTQGLVVGGVADYVISFTPTDPSVLAAGLDVPNAITVDGENVYWTENWGDTSAVKKMSKNGGTITTLVSGFYRPSAIAVNSQYVYYTESPGPNEASIKRVSKNGGAAVTIASGQPSAWGLALDGSYVYWTDGYGGSVRKAPLGGGQVTVLATGLSTPSGIAVDANSVYCSETEGSGRIIAVPLGGGSLRTVAYARSRSLAVHGVELFWTERLFSNNAKIMKVPTTGDAITTLVSNLDNPFDLTTDGTAVYWVENRSNGAVKEVGAHGGDAMNLSDGDAFPVAIATDGAFVYWVENDGTSGTGKIKRAPTVPVKPVVTMDVPDPNAREAGPDTGRVAVTRTGPTTEPLTVAYSLTGTPVNGGDYEHLSGSITIPAGQTTASIEIVPIDDRELEQPETVLVSLASGSAYFVGTSPATNVTIADNDGVITITTTDSVASEVGANSGTFTINRTGSIFEAMTVNISLTGTATNAVDYAGLPSSVVIPPDTASTTVVITPVVDALAEGDETAVLTVTSSPHYQVGDASIGIVTIADAVPPATNVIATATSTAAVNLTWNAVAGASSYRIYRSTDALMYSLAGTSSGPAFTDTAVTPNTAYLYKVRTYSGAESVDSNTDVATAVTFAETIIPAVTKVSRTHFVELLTAVNALRALAGLSAFAFTTPPVTGGLIKRQHLVELRTALDEARAVLGIGPIAYSEPTISAGVTTIKAAHVIELRNGVN